jgi:hypothetical protein
MFPVFIPTRKKALRMAMIFMDESGHFADQDYFCLAGYLASDAGWDALCQEWKILLDKHGIPGIHMREIMSEGGKSPAAKWKMQDKLNMLSEFILVIRKHIHTGFGVSIKAKHYREIIKTVHAELIKTGIKKPKQFKAQVFCVARIVRQVLTYFTETLKSDEKLCLIFDDSEHYSMSCYGFVSELKRRNAKAKEMISSITFADDSVFYPLQCADILAYATCNELKKGTPQWLDTNIFTALFKSEDPAYGLPYLGEGWDERNDEELAKAIILEMMS